MIIIREKNDGKKIYYERLVCDKIGKNEIVQIVKYRLAKVVKDGFEYFTLYDDNNVAIRPFFRYVNFHLAHLAYNSREKAAHALRIFYCWLECTKTEITEIKKKDIINLAYFLQGYSPVKGLYSFQLKRKIKNKSINDYFSIYRSYLKSIGINCDDFNDTKNMEYTVNTANGDTVSKRVTKYVSNLKTGTPVRRVPRYISPEEFARVVNIVRAENNATAEVIIRLMFEYGLRIGEVLGITSEDVTERNIDGELRPIIYIRNRATDNKKYQSAKNLMSINSPEEYSSPNYTTENLGYQLIYLTDDFYDMLNNYIEARLVDVMNKKQLERSVADNVKRSKHSTENHYIFLNRNGYPVSGKVWNKYLRAIFEQAGLQVDKEVKIHNLNHRFRHGFAMFNVKYRHVDILDLMVRMRHSSASSTAVYYRPTESDEYKIKTEFVKDLYDIIPALKEMPNYYADTDN